MTNNNNKVTEIFTVISKSRRNGGMGIISTTKMPITPAMSAISPCVKSLLTAFLIVEFTFSDVMSNSNQCCLFSAYTRLFPFFQLIHIG